MHEPTPGPGVPQSRPVPDQSGVPYFDLTAQNAALWPEIEGAVAQVISRGDFILGEEVRAFEEAMADYCGSTHAVAVDSGTSALEIGLRAMGVGPGDEVIAPANTFIATVLAISYVGATPVLVDVDPETRNIDPGLVESVVTSRTRAIIPVHLHGHPADMHEIARIADVHGLLVLEDASQAHGARYGGRPVGTFGHAAAFSLYPAKNLGAYGDAGILVTDDPAIADRAASLRNYGSTQKYHHEVLGYNHRMDTIQAAILRIKLRHLDTWNAARRDIADLYQRTLAELEPDILLPVERPPAESVYHVYAIRHGDRDRLRQYLTEQGIGTLIHYPIPVHLQPAYAHLGYQRGDFPASEMLADEMISLPMYPELEPRHVMAVVSAVRSFVRHE